MNIEDMNLEQTIERLAELDEIVERSATVEEIDEATNEKKELIERKAFLEDLQERKQIARDIQAGKITANIIEERKEETKMELTYKPDSMEYRNVWLNKMRGVALNETEERAFSDANAVVPDATANMIIDSLVDKVPLLNEIELLRVKGHVSFAVNTVAPALTLKAGGSAVDEATTTMVQVTLGSYTMSTIVRIGADVASMAISAFEGWLVAKLTDQIAYKIEYYIIKGSGESQPKGIDAITYVDGTNAVDWAGAALADEDINEAIGLLPAAYDGNAKFLMSKKTFYTNVLGLTDTNNVPLVQRDANNRFVLQGFPVIFSDQVDAGDIFYGDFKRGMVGNLSNEMKVERDRNLGYNSWDYLGWCSFDCKPSGINCIVKIAVDITA